MNFVEDLRETLVLIVRRISESVIPIARSGSGSNGVDVHRRSRRCEVDQCFGGLRCDTVTDDEKRPCVRTV